MGKSIRITIISILLMILLVIQSIFVFAITIRKSDKHSTSGIEMQLYDDGSLKELKYSISSTGATSGIRYRTPAITVEIGGMTTVISTKKIVEALPPPGKQEFYDITVTGEDIIDQYKRQVGRELTVDEIKDFENAFAQPDKIGIGAHIELYNAGTGEVLETITSIDEIRSKAPKHGFGEKHLKDMETRFNKQSQQDIELGDPWNDEADEVPKTGLRPSVIVDDDC